MNDKLDEFIQLLIKFEIAVLNRKHTQFDLFNKLMATYQENVFNSGWISVDDGLPTQLGYYLVYDTNFGVNVDGFYPPLMFGKWQIEKGEFKTFKNVTHWQCLPPVPKEECYDFC